MQTFTPTNTQADVTAFTLQDLRPMKLAEVCQATSLSETQIKRLVTAGQFPAPVKRGAQWTRWLTRDVAEWLEGL